MRGLKVGALMRDFIVFDDYEAGYKGENAEVDECGVDVGP